MGRTPTVMQAEAFEAIERLVSAGEYPTHARVRESLGSRGSPIVLQRYMAKWYRINGPRLTGAAPAPDSDRMDAGIRHHLESATRAALAQLDAEHSTREKALSDRAAGLDARKKSLDDQEELLATQHKAKQELIDRLTEDRQDAMKAQAKAEAVARELEKDLALLERELAATRDERVALAKERDALVARLDELARDHAAADAAAETARAQVAQLQSDLEAAAARHAALQSELDGARDAHAAAERDARRELVTATERFVALQDAAGEERRKAAAVLADAQASLRKSQAAVDALKSDLADAQAAVKVANAQRERLAETLARHEAVAAVEERGQDRLEVLHDAIAEGFRAIGQQLSAVAAPGKTR